MISKVHPLTTLLLLCCLVQPSIAQRMLHDDSKLREGDLLFVVAPAANAITDVTTGIDAQPIDHVGIYHIEKGGAVVIEANYDGVVETPFSSFLQHSPYLLVGRVTGRVDIQESIKNARSHLGKSYDHVYQQDDDAIYCSELVQKSYVDKEGRLLFSPIGMSFHDADGQILPYWEDFYSRRALDVPEGQPGSNPGDLSRRKNVKIKYRLTPIAK